VPAPTINQRTNTIYRRHHEAKIVRRIVMAILLLLTITLAGAIIGGYSYIQDALKPVDSNSTESVDITIPIGSSSESIGKILEENDLIKDGLIFKYYVRYKNEDGFQAGDYSLTKSMDMQQIINSIKDGKVYQEAALTVQVPEGLRIPEVAAKIAEQTEHSEDEVIEKMKDKQYIQSLIEKYSPVLTKKILDDEIIWPLEGYLFPATYDFMEEDPSIEEILEKMIQQTVKIINKYSADLEQSEYDTHQILTLASIIEEEAQKEEDRFLISGVFYNRIGIDMPLQSDVTVTYAHQKNTVKVLNKDTEYQSPYNTYTNTGIPIGPIAAPGESSIKAALNPEANENYYFFARPSGEVLYRQTYDEHMEVYRKYIDEWNELANKED
jgi:UPF0755 protein